MKNNRVVVVTITFGDRWKYLSQVIESVVKDHNIFKLIVVDNGSINPILIEEGIKKYKEKIILLKNKKNLGSAGGFAAGLSRAREIDCDYVFILDDDCIPEDNATDTFIKNYDFFDDKKIVFSGSRISVLSNKEHFYRPSIVSDGVRGTFFEIFSIKKILYFLKLLFGLDTINKRGPFIPIIPTEGFVYGGAFLPIDAVRNAPLPDESLFLYGDDVEYSWGIKNIGYSTYLCSNPKIFDIDQTFGTNNSHIFGQFEQQLPASRVYFRIRNMVRLSIKHSRQNSLSLFLNIIIWILGILILGFSRKGFSTFFFSRTHTIIEAVLCGYNINRPIPKEFIIQ